MGSVGLGMGLGFADTHFTRWSLMEMIENIALMVFLMFAGVSVTVAVLIGFIYFLEILND